jgi:GAF domain-containing protein
MAESKFQKAQDTQERLRRLYELALTVAGDPIEVFDQIVRIIAELFGVRLALVEKLEADKVVTLSMYLDGKIHHEGVFDLAGTPCASVRQSRTACAFNHASETFPQDQFLKDFGIDFYIGVPVISTEGEVIAIINAMHDRPVMLNDSDKLFLEAMASRVRLELERAEQATEARIVRTLLDISREVLSVRGLDETLQLIVERTKELLSVDLTAIAVIKDAAGATEWKVTSGSRTDLFLKTSFAPGKGTAGRAIAARGTVVLEGIGERPELPAEEFPIHIAEGIRNAIGVPLFAGGKVTGALIAGYRSDIRFTERQIKVVEAITTQAAVAVENTRLFSELAAANDRLTEADRLKSEMIAELSTPIIPVWDRVLLAPIIGALGADRARGMTEALVERVSDAGAEVAIVDITGVRSMDAAAAEHLRNTVSAIQILGARCIITGIGPKTAQVLVSLGISLAGIETRRKLSDALHLAIRYTDGEIR